MVIGVADKDLKGDGKKVEDEILKKIEEESKEIKHDQDRTDTRQCTGVAG